MIVLPRDTIRERRTDKTKKKKKKAQRIKNILPIFLWMHYFAIEPYGSVCTLVEVSVITYSTAKLLKSSKK